MPHHTAGNAYTRTAGDDRVLENYLPILIFVVIGVLVGVIAPAAGYYLGPRRPDSEKDSPVRVRLRGVRDRAHEVRRALLLGRHPLHHLRSRDRLPFPLGGRARPARRLWSGRHVHLPGDPGGRIHL